MEAITSHPAVLLVTQLGSFGLMVWVVIAFSKSISKKDEQLAEFYKQTSVELRTLTERACRAIDAVVAERHMLVRELRNRPCLNHGDGLNQLEAGVPAEGVLR